MFSETFIVIWHSSVMKYCKKKGLLGFILLFQSVLAVAQGDCCNTRNYSYSDGEKLTFRVYYNVGILWFNAGTGTLEVTRENYNGKQSYHVCGRGKTNKSYELFFKVNDHYDTYIDQETMLPLRFLRDVNEGGVKFKNDVQFNQTRCRATSDTCAYKIPRCTQDMLSAIYYARDIDYNAYKPGDKFQVNLFLDNKLYSLNIKYLGKEKVRTKMGEFNAIKIMPQVITGTIFKDDDKLTVWVSDDANHLPLRINSPILVGSVKVDLVGYEHLRNPFTSLLAQY